MKQVFQLFEPNRLIDRKAMRLLILGQIAFVVFIWGISKTVFLPKPGEILAALSDLWNSEGLGGELVTSFMLNLQALALSTVLSLGLAYVSVIPFFRPMVSVLGKLRFLSLVGLSFFFTIWTKNGQQLKVSLLVFGVSVFFVTSMADVVASVPKEKFDLARTLRMPEWRVAWEVVVLGTADQSFDALRQNAAMGYMMITLVEGISRSGGGVGAMLLDNSKHFHLAAICAIDGAILAVGIAQDYFIGVLKKICCPYATLTLERK
jgi:NitT/TauT family transport system permease protein